MTVQNSSDPLHGVTLKTILSELVGQFGWEEVLPWQFRPAPHGPIAVW